MQEVLKDDEFTLVFQKETAASVLVILVAWDSMFVEEAGMDCKRDKYGIWWM